MTTEEKAALVGLCRIEIKRWKAASESNPNIRYMVNLMEIALGALEAEPVAYTAQDNIDGFGGSVGYMWPPGNEKPSDVALYKCTPVAAPEDWKLVPVEPTQEMLEEIWLTNDWKEAAIRTRYAALLAAAPTP